MKGILGGWLCMRCGYFNTLGKTCLDCRAPKDG